jgi:hypothetical protein
LFIRRPIGPIRPLGPIRPIGPSFGQITDRPALVGFYGDFMVIVIVNWREYQKFVVHLWKLKNKSNIMARPIKETPVLRGKDAEKFAEKIANPAPVSQSEKDAARRAYEAFKAISTFPM